MEAGGISPSHGRRGSSKGERTTRKKKSLRKVFLTLGVKQQSNYDAVGNSKNFHVPVALRRGGRRPGKEKHAPKRKKVILLKTDFLKGGVGTRAEYIKADDISV